MEVNLYEFAYIPAWYEQLHELAEAILPEPWRFKAPETEPVNFETPILERYICQVFRKTTIDYNYAEPRDADYIFYVRNEFCCFNTGLYTRQYLPVYMCFERNKRKDTTRKWVFKEFAVESSKRMKYIQPLPERPKYAVQQWMTYYDPEGMIRLNMDRLLGDQSSLSKLPIQVLEGWNRSLVVETAVELSRRKCLVDMNLAVMAVSQGQIHYLLPLYMTKEDKPDLAIALSIMEGYYIGDSFMTLETAYSCARMLARPSAHWLADLVE